MKYKKTVLDFETTGLSSKYDEILQVSVIDDKGNVLLNEYCKPKIIKEWEEAEYIHGITPDKVKNKKPFEDYVEILSNILLNSEEIIIYNSSFEISFLDKYNVKYNCNIYDLMLEFAEVYGQYNEYYGNYTWKSLEVCCNYYGYCLNEAHNSLEDCKATLYCYNKLINGEGAYKGEDHIGKTVKQFIEDVLSKLVKKDIYLRIRHNDKDLYNYIKGHIKNIEDIKYKNLLNYKIRNISYLAINDYILYVDKCIEAELDIKEQKLIELKELLKEKDNARINLLNVLWESQDKIKSLEKKILRLENKNKKLQEEYGIIKKPKIYMFNSYGFYTSEYCKSTKKPMFKSSREYRPFSDKLFSKTKCKQIKKPVQENEEIYAFYKVRHGYCALYFRDI